MKTSEINYVNKTICKFIQDISICQDLILKEAPDVWQTILMSMSALSDVSVFLEAAKNHEEDEDLSLYNSFRLANGMLPVKKLPSSFNKGEDRIVDLNKYLSSKKSI